MLKRGSKQLKSWSGFQNHRVLSIIGSMILIFAALVFLLSSKGKRLSSPIDLSHVKWNSFRSSVEFHPTVEFRNETDLIWQIPDSPKGVLFLAHGCNGKAVNFWDRSPSCPNCVGLPEERLIVLHALARKFAVLTISSAGRCWSFGKEKVIVKSLVTWWIEKHNLGELPLVALGASSGGYFVSALALNIKFNSITLMIAEGVFDKMDIPNNYPPTLFVHMPKDRVRTRAINTNIEVLRKKGIDVAEIKCMEFPLTPSFLSDRIPGLDESVSNSLFKLFHDKNFVDDNGYMRNDGRATHWKAALKEGQTLISDKDDWIYHIQEELNLAFAYHEMTSLQSVQILNWFESHMS